MTRWLVCFLLIGVLAVRAAVVAQSETADGVMPTAAEIELAVGELASRNFKTRQAASDRLWRFGHHAESALLLAARSSKLEVARRAEAVLEKLRLGISPDTPKHLVGQIRSYMLGDSRIRYGVINELLTANELGTIVRLMRHEKEEPQQQYLANAVLSQSRRIIGENLDAENQLHFEQLLELLAESDQETGTHLKNYAAFLRFKGTLDDRTRQLQASVQQPVPATRVGEPPTPQALQRGKELRKLAYLLAFQGKSEQALGVAQLAQDNHLRAAIFIQLNQWTAFDDASLVPGQAGLENSAFAACIHGLAGSKELQEQDFAAIREHAAANPKANAWAAAEAFMLTGRWDEARELIKENLPGQYFELLVYQGRLDDALTFAGIDDPQQADLSRWYLDRRKVLALASPEFNDQFEMGLAVVRTFHDMGLKEKYEPLLKLLELDASQDKRGGDRLANLIVIEFAIRAEEIAYRHLAQAVSAKQNLSPLRIVLGENYATYSQFWWDVLCDAWPGIEKDALAKDLVKILRPSASIELSMSFDELLKAATAFASKQAVKRTKANYLEIIGSICAEHKKWDVARTYFEGVLKSNDIGTTAAAQERAGIPFLIKIAETYFDEGDLQKAAEYFHRARKIDQGDIASTFMEGHCLSKSGQEKLGQELMDRAKMMPLASANTRYELAKTLDRYRLADEARQQRESIMDIPNNLWVGSDAFAIRYAAASLGDALYKTDKARAADFWQHYLMHFLTGTNFIRTWSYATVAQRVEQARALAALQAGRPDEFASRLWAAHELRRGDSEFVITIFKELPDAVQQPGFQRVFDSVFAHYDELCKRFPKSGSFRNHLAWMSVSCKQQLEAALEYSMQSVELEPENSAYLDTLAAIYFETGEFDLAISFQEHALKIRPDYQYFQDQLAKFKKAKADRE